MKIITFNNQFKPKKIVMKPSLSLLIAVSIYLFSCVNPPKSNQAESRIKDSTYWAERESKARARADSVFTGFMDLKWNSSKKEAIKYLKTTKELKVDFISDDDIIYLKGSFAGGTVKTLALSYYNDKLYDAWVDFGYKSDAFRQSLREKLELKYGKGYINGQHCTWEFDISSDKNRPKIFLSDGGDGLSLLYMSKYGEEYEAKRKELKDSKEKNSVKLKDL